MRQRASELAGTNDGDVVHLWTIVVADMSKPPLRGKVAIVTGGSRGIGLAIAQALVAEGVQVAITGRSESHLSAARPLVEAAGPGAVETLRADVRAYAEVERAITATVARFGGLDILVNNAGVGVFADVAAMTPARWAEVIDTTLAGAFNACHAALPHLGRRNGGFIINIQQPRRHECLCRRRGLLRVESGTQRVQRALMQEVRTTISRQLRDAGIGRH